MTYGIVIPARMQSNRLPGKPLINLCGKPMIQRTWERCVEVVPKDRVVVATDSEDVARCVNKFGGQCLLTPSECLTGTDRVAAANTQLDYDTVINVQGDEPLIDPSDVQKIIDEALLRPSAVINAYTEIEDLSQLKSLTIPKVVFSQSGSLLYASRLPIPGTKTGNSIWGYRQVCIYSFPRDSLIEFAKRASKTPLEESEDIELLRFIELDVKVHMLRVGAANVAVDVPEDVVRVEELIAKIEAGVASRNK